MKARRDVLDLGGEPVEVQWKNDDAFHVSGAVAERPVAFRILHESQGECVIETPRGLRRVFVEVRDGVVEVFCGGTSLRARKALPTDRGAVGDDGDHANLVAPMTGRVIRLEAAVGDDVEEGATLAVVEAMKMEHPLQAPFQAVVVELSVEEGDTVDMGETIVRLERRTEN